MFGFRTFGRPDVRRNDVNLVYDLKAVQLARSGTAIDGGMLDPTFGVRYVGFQLPEELARRFQPCAGSIAG